MTSSNALASAQGIFDARNLVRSKKTDFIFLYLFLCQWVFAMILAGILSPQTWTGAVSQIHPHVYLAGFLGGSLAFGQVYMIYRYAGTTLVQDLNAIIQILFSALFIHLTGGRIETHFHIFGSLALLSSYRSFRPILIATTVTLLDHLLRGYYWPESVYGVLFASPLRAFEHAGWVIFEDVVLYYTITIARKELWSIAQLENQRQTSLITAAKMSELGVSTGNIAHEINNPLAIAQGKLKGLLKQQQTKNTIPENVQIEIQKIFDSTERIRKIVDSVKSFSRDSAKDAYSNVPLEKIIQNTLNLCTEKIKSIQCELKLDPIPQQEIKCHESELEQVLLNLLNNALDAIEPLAEKWIHLSFQISSCEVSIHVTDSGFGIPEKIVGQMMNPFFTTKAVGKGTGLGLSISREILNRHQGVLMYDKESFRTSFIIRLPMASAFIEKISA